MLLDKIINKLVADYETRNPFKIAVEMGVKIVYEDLGKLNGYYNAPYRCKIIHINENKSENTQIFTCAHELGHAIMHEDVNFCFLRMKTLINSNKYENQANEFAVRLVIGIESVKNLMDRMSSEFIDTFGIDEEIAVLIAKYCIEGKKKIDASLVGTLGHTKLEELGVLGARNYIDEIKKECEFQTL